MKTKKPVAAKRARSTKAHQKLARSRPLHKRVLLHPFSVMVLLCAGVLIIGSTMRSYAADYDVTATVPAELPTAPAVISDPINEQHFSAQPITVSGTCPDWSFVKLYRNGAFSGVAQCSPTQTFQIQTSLAVGANVLDPKVFNATGQEGPTGVQLTVFYDELTVPPSAPPTTEPTALVVDAVETLDYTTGAVSPASLNPTISGWAPPYSDVTVTFHSEVTYCRTQADGNGLWSCTLDNALDIGVHRVEVAAVTPDGKRLVFPAFQIRVIRGMASLKKAPPASPFALTGEYIYTAKRVRESFSFRLGVSGGKSPYNLTVDWGDGSESGLNHPDQSDFTIAHVYTSPGKYVVLVRGIDASKQTALLQLSAIVKGSSEATAGAGWLNNTMSGIRQWLWLVWPVYIAVLLMVLSYWIGEQEAYRQLVSKRRMVHTGRGGRGR